MKSRIKKELLTHIDRLMAPEGYLFAGFPTYRRLFGRDTCIVSLQLLDINPEIAKNTLYILASYQGKKVDKRREEEPGKILHEHYVHGIYDKLIDLKMCHGKLRKLKQFTTWGFPYYGSIDATAWFLILYAKYFHKTKDTVLARKLWPNVLMALDWIKKYGDFDNDLFIENINKNPFGLVHQGWKDMLDFVGYKIKPPIAMVEVQGYYYLAYLEIAKVAGYFFKKSKLSSALKEKAKKLKKKFNKKFWLEKEGFYALALDGDKKQIDSLTTNPGHLIFTGIMDKEKEIKVIKRLFKNDFFTKWGIQTLSAKDPLFNPRTYHGGSIWPSDNWVIYYGLIKSGYDKEAAKIRTGLLRAYESFKGIPELYRVEKGKLLPGIFFSNLPVCTLQAWASCALINVLQDENIDTNSAN